MPELPAVEFTKNLLLKHCLNKRLSAVQFLPEEDALIFTPDASDALKAASKILKVGRWGKQLWLQLDIGFLLLHLGMTGFVQVKGYSRLNYESSPSNASKTADEHTWPPRFTKLVLTFEDGTEVAFADARRLARVSRTEARSEAELLSILKSKLGFDPLLSTDVTVESFAELISRRSAPLKSLLLNQTIVAGVGNWMADDILLEARLAPHRPGSSLSLRELKALLRAIQTISKVAVEAEAQKSHFPRGWLFHIRWAHGNETLLGQPVKEDRIAGRSTFWIPKVQK